MKFCENCGTELEENSLFCEDCGYKVEGENDLPKPKQSSSAKQIKIKPLTKTQKIVGASVVAAGLVLFGGYKLGESVFSEENQKSDLIDALVSKNAEELAKVVATTDPNFDVTAENLESFISFLEQNPNYLNQMANELNMYNSFESFYIRQNGKRLGMYDSYELMITPVYADLYTNAEGTVISINDEELLTADADNFSREIGPFAPGIMEFKAIGTINGNQLETTRQVEWIDSSDYNEIDLSLHGSYFSVESDLNDATVYLNDTEIGALKDGVGEFGPYQWEPDMKVHIGKQFEDDELVSEPEVWEEGYNWFSFYDMTVADSYDLESVLQGMYNQVGSIYRYYDEEDTGTSELDAFFKPESPAFEDQRLQFITYAKEMVEDEEVSSLNFDVEIMDYVQTGMRTFDVEYEVTYDTYYNWSSDKNDRMRHFSKEATIVFEPTNNPNKDYDSLISEIRNEELLYEEGDS